MQPLQPQLAAKLAQYRAVFETSCSGLFGGGVTVTVEMEDESSDVGPAPTAPPDAQRPPTEPEPGAALAGAAEAVTKNAPTPAPRPIPTGHDTEPSGVPTVDSGKIPALTTSDDTPSMQERRKASAEFDAAPTVATAVDLPSVKAEIEKALHF